MNSGPQPISQVVASILGRVEATKLNRNLHTELHAFVEETRGRWQDTYPFARWLGKCNGVPLANLYMIRGDVEDAKPTSKAKLFFWKVARWKKTVIPTPPLGEKAMKPDNGRYGLH